MSVLAKVFIVIEALLVMCYLGVASTLYQHRTDWRNSYLKLRERYYATARRAKREVVVYDSQIKNKDTDIQGKEKEVGDLKRQLDNILNEYQTTSKNLSRKNNEYDRLQEDISKLTQQNDDLDDEIKSLRQAKSELADRLKRAEDARGKAELQVARLIAQKFNMEGDLGDMRKDYVSVRKDLRDKELLIALAEERGVNFATLLDGPPVPLVRGSVQAVKADIEPALVLIDVGKDEEVEEGFRFSVYRGEKFVGKVVVERVERDSAACRVVFASEGESIQAGDSVSTRLP